MHGWIHVHETQNAGAIHWRLIKRTSRHSARMKTNLDRGNPVGDNARHSYPADNTDVDVSRAKADMKRKAGRGPPSRMYGESVSLSSTFHAQSVNGRCKFGHFFHSHFFHGHIFRGHIFRGHFSHGHFFRGQSFLHSLRGRPSIDLVTQ